MAETRAVPEHLVSPENLSTKPPTSDGPVEPHTNNENVRTSAQTNDSSLMGQRKTQEEPAAKNWQPQNEDRSGSTNYSENTSSVKFEPKEEPQDVNIKEEVEEETASQQSEESPLVGKLKIKPMASLVEINQPNPQSELHPFFAGFDDHIRSLIMNRQPQFPLSSPLIQRPPQFMYYDNSTNMNLKKMLNGHKMAQVSPARHPTFRPYVPINVPRPPLSQAPPRNSFSTQTSPMSIGIHPDDATPSTSYKWLPQDRPPVRNFNHQNNSPTQNASPANISVPQYTPTKTSPASKTIPLNTAPGLAAFPTLLTPLHTTPTNASNQKVSTSSSTDDLEKHSSENTVTIKTEVDLGIDSKEQLQATLPECTEFESHFMDSSNPQYKMSESNLGIPDTKPQIAIITGDAVIPPDQELLRREYVLPAYSTKGLLLCKCCDFRCNKKKKMKEHFETMHTAETRFKCFYCIKKLVPLPYYKTVHDLEHHVGKVHRGEKRWQCKYCTKTYKSHGAYKLHLERSCSQSRPYACHMCTFTCVTEAGLQKHIKSHERMQETQECPFCNKTFKKFYIKQHLITVHAPPEEKPFQCMSCDYAAGTATVLESHYKRSGHDKKFKCDQCEYACRIPSMLKYHKLAHKNGGLSKLICGINGCDITCLNKRSLEAHRQTHSLPRSEVFSCPDKDCPRQFKNRQSLRNHTSKTLHHKPFKCPDCTLRFLKEESVNKHIQSFHVDKLLKQMENPHPKEPVRVKNVVDVYNYVESGGVQHESFEKARYNEEDSVTNFGCWLGISGFGDIIGKADCDNEVPSGLDSEEGKNEKEDKKIEEEEDDDDEDYHNFVPETCLVEFKQEETEEETPRIADRKTDNEETISFKQEEEEDEDEDDDSEYQHVNPEISCLVECQQNAASTDFNEKDESETVCLPASLVKVEVEESDAS